MANRKQANGARNGTAKPARDGAAGLATRVWGAVRRNPKKAIAATAVVGVGAYALLRRRGKAAKAKTAAKGR
jgi:hypothetical protein